MQKTIQIVAQGHTVYVGIRDLIHGIQPQIHNTTGEVLGSQVQDHRVNTFLNAEQTRTATGRVFAFLTLFDYLYVHKGVRNLADGHQTQVGLGGNICTGYFLGSGDGQENGLNAFPSDASQIDIFHSCNETDAPFKEKEGHYSKE